MSNNYYTLNNILSKKAQYNMIIGERSNGKTYACLKYALERYVNNNEQLAYVRRWQDDFKGNRGMNLFESLVSNKEIEKMTKGRWTNVYYYSGRWYLCKYDDKNVRVCDNTPFAFGFALSSMEHDKSVSYPNVTTIIFDEFLTRGIYIKDEFVVFCNLISTIVRDRMNVSIFMLGNTVNKFAPYFDEMGLEHIEYMKQGTIDVYEYGESELKVAVEYCGNRKSKKKSDIYFAFDNPKLKMITSGVWEVDLYPHCPYRYVPKNILYTYFIEFGNNLLQCEVILVDDKYFTYIHRKTTPLKNFKTELVFGTEYSIEINRRRSLLKPRTELEQKILSFYRNDLVFYQDNTIGEIVRNYINWCTSNK